MYECFLIDQPSLNELTSQHTERLRATLDHIERHVIENKKLVKWLNVESAGSGEKPLEVVRVPKTQV